MGGSVGDVGIIADRFSLGKSPNMFRSFWKRSVSIFAITVDLVVHMSISSSVKSTSDLTLLGDMFDSQPLTHAVTQLLIVR